MKPVDLYTKISENIERKWKAYNKNWELKTENI